MQKLRWPLTLTVVGLLGVSTWLFVGAQALTHFLPPRTAVVDIARVFETFEKRKDRAEELKTNYDSVMAELANLKENLSVLERELQDLKPGSESFRRKYLEHLEVAAKVKDIQSTKGAEFDQKRTAFLEEIRKEIKNEIKMVAEAEELDLVLEKAVTADNPRAGVGFQWSIVHFSKPEFDITQKVTDRLNERYKRPQ